MIELTEKEVKALLEIIPGSITHAKQAIYYYEQVDRPTESDQENYWYYATLLEALTAVQGKLKVISSEVDVKGAL